MKKLFALVVMFSVSACALFSAKGVKSALDLTQMACVLVYDWAEDDSWVAKQCNIVDDYLPEVRRLLEAAKKSRAMRADMEAKGTLQKPPASDAGVDAVKP